MSPVETTPPDDDPPYSIQPVRPIDVLRREAMAAAPPRDPGPFRISELVDLATLGADLRFDLRYATARNFLGEAVYDVARAFLQKPAARALVSAAEGLRKRGFGLLVYDAYRPWFITKIFWEATPDSLKRFVASPATGSRHNRGAAVDVGLYDLRTMKLISMPSGYDEFTERAHADYDDGPPAALEHRNLLRAQMENCGFVGYEYEWWHFDFSDWKEYPILNIPIKNVAATSSTERTSPVVEEAEGAKPHHL